MASTPVLIRNATRPNVMKDHARQLLLALLLCVVSTTTHAQSDRPLPSWNDGNAKNAIVDFVRRVTLNTSTDYVPPAERIAVFDNDGTLWVEQPMYTQLAFAIDRVKILADQHPDWKQKQPFKAVLDDDLAALAAAGEKGLMQLIMASHAGKSTAEFEQLVKDWFATARHPHYQRPYNELTYLPMVELLDYLRANDFKTYIVSGGASSSCGRSQWRPTASLPSK